jgi:hypothetical protein
MTSFRGQPSWDKMSSSEAELTALACHPTKKVNKAEELTYLSINITLYVKCHYADCHYSECYGALETLYWSELKILCNTAQYY